MTENCAQTSDITLDKPHVDLVGKDREAHTYTKKKKKKSLKLGHCYTISRILLNMPDFAVKTKNHYTVYIWHEFINQSASTVITVDMATISSLLNREHENSSDQLNKLKFHIAGSK